MDQGRQTRHMGEIAGHLHRVAENTGLILDTVQDGNANSAAVVTCVGELQATIEDLVAEVQTLSGAVHANTAAIQEEGRQRNQWHNLTRQLRMQAQTNHFLSRIAVALEAIQDNVVQVIGLLHQSVELVPSNLWLPSPVQEVNWTFESKGKLYKVAQFDNHQPRFYKEQFNGRMELLYDGTTLLIKDLRMEDSGNYTAQIILKKDDHIERFMLIVYEPVPDPSIMIVMEERTSHWCNATLHCSVPTNSSPLNYNWIYKNTDSVYEESGDTIHISLNYSWDMEFQCIVHNPADQKNVSKQERCYAQDHVRIPG
ncbi:uncharacterized protein LOC120920083 [Rana temporaria]|uniref:uncharacterized protein LOC120920083 n=1 Tax=Rana temporaria TaxID=8407 RepID=UPI001AADD590|nr:uncharacterized protein LOC120920083 [Rana temporaria]